MQRDVADRRRLTPEEERVHDLLRGRPPADEVLQIVSEHRDHMTGIAVSQAWVALGYAAVRNPIAAVHLETMLEVTAAVLARDHPLPSRHLSGIATGFAKVNSIA